MLFNILFLKFGFLIWQDILEIISRGIVVMEFWNILKLFQALYTRWSWTRYGWQYSTGGILGVQIAFHLILAKNGPLTWYSD